MVQQVNGINKIKITKDLVVYLRDSLKKLPKSKFHGSEHNEEHDKVDFSLTFQGQHYWLVLLREGRKVPIKTQKGL